jgi:hypothetical protein
MSTSLSESGREGPPRIFTEIEASLAAPLDAKYAQSAGRLIDRTNHVRVANGVSSDV